MLDEDDRLLYEVYEIHRPEVPGELLQGHLDRPPWQGGQPNIT